MYFKSNRKFAVGDTTTTTVGACTAVGPGGLNAGDMCSTPGGGVAQWSGTQLQMYNGVPFAATDYTGLLSGGFAANQLLGGCSGTGCPAGSAAPAAGSAGGILATVTSPFASVFSSIGLSSIASSPPLIAAVVGGAALLLLRRKKA